MKKPFINTLFVLLLIGLTAAWWAFSVVMTELLGDAGRLFAEALIVFAIFLILVEILLRTVDLRRKSIDDERQLQALLGLYHALKPDAPIPMLRSAALGSDTALEYVKLIRQLKPKVVVELGSGVSTILAALQLRQNGGGRVYALDDDENWAMKTRDDLLEHHVLEFGEVRFAALKPLKVENENVQWYDLDKVSDLDRIDMLLVDGPRDLQDRGNRRPGLTHLYARFSNDVVIIVDDGVRPRWRNWVYAWAAEHDFVVEEPFLNEKRSLILYRKGSVLAAQRDGVAPHLIPDPEDTSQHTGDKIPF
jgi:Methyltransferase domain